MIPIHDEQRQLIAYAGRWPGELPDGEPKGSVANFVQEVLQGQLPLSVRGLSG
jgi:hypothetical protein